MTQKAIKSIRLTSKDDEESIGSILARDLLRVYSLVKKDKDKTARLIGLNDTRYYGRVSLDSVVVEVSTVLVPACIYDTLNKLEKQKGVDVDTTIPAKIHIDFDLNRINKFDVVKYLKETFPYKIQ